MGDKIMTRGFKVGDIVALIHRNKEITLANIDYISDDYYPLYVVKSLFGDTQAIRPALVDEFTSIVTLDAAIYFCETKRKEWDRKIEYIKEWQPKRTMK